MAHSYTLASAQNAAREAPQDLGVSIPSFSHRQGIPGSGPAGKRQPEETGEMREHLERLIPLGGNQWARPINGYLTQGDSVPQPGTRN